MVYVPRVCGPALLLVLVLVVVKVALGGVVDAVVQRNTELKSGERIDTEIIIASILPFVCTNMRCLSKQAPQGFCSKSVYTCLTDMQHMCTHEQTQNKTWVQATCDTLYCAVSSRLLSCVAWHTKTSSNTCLKSRHLFIFLTHATRLTWSQLTALRVSQSQT